MSGLTQTLDAAHPTVKRVSFEQAWEAHRGRVFHWALRYAAGDTSCAEDLTHDVFLKLWANLSRLEDTDDLGGWLYCVTARLAVSRFRSRHSLLRAVRKWLQPSEDPAPDEALDARRSSHRALVALELLPDRERVALCMVALDGLSQREVATRLGLSEGYVSKLLQRARARLNALGWEVES